MPPPEGCTASGSASVPLPCDYVLAAFDVEHTGTTAGETIFDPEIFGFGSAIFRATDGCLGSCLAKIDTLVRSTKSMTPKVFELIAEPAGVTSEKLLAAPALVQALTYEWVA